jgi:hypothetical protein
MSFKLLQHAPQTMFPSKFPIGFVILVALGRPQLSIKRLEGVIEDLPAK